MSVRYPSSKQHSSHKYMLQICMHSQFITHVKPCSSRRKATSTAENSITIMWWSACYAERMRVCENWYDGSKYTQMQFMLGANRGQEARVQHAVVQALLRILMMASAMAWLDFGFCPARRANPAKRITACTSWRSLS